MRALTTLFIALSMMPMLSYAIGGLRLKSPAAASAPAQKTSMKKDHDCTGRSNTMGHQLTNLEALQKQLCEQDAASCDAVEEVALIGEESGEIVSNDPNHPDAQLAEAVGPVVFCGKAAGNASIVEYNGKPYLVGNAHSFYRDGKLKCNKKTGVFAPDYHYRGNNEIKHNKVYRFKLPPLNHKTALTSGFDGLNDRSIGDIVILELENNSVLTNQLGKKRATLKILDINSNELPVFSKENEIVFISNRTNFHNKNKSSIERGCQFKHSNGFKVKKHNCDSGPVSSGAPLVFSDNNQNYFIGLHYSGEKTTDQEFESTEKGNFFIPSSYVQEEFEKTLKQTLSL